MLARRPALSKRQCCQLAALILDAAQPLPDRWRRSRIAYPNMYGIRRKTHLTCPRVPAMPCTSALNIFNTDKPGAGAHKTTSGSSLSAASTASSPQHRPLPQRPGTGCIRPPPRFTQQAGLVVHSGWEYLCDSRLSLSSLGIRDNQGLPFLAGGAA